MPQDTVYGYLTNLSNLLSSIQGLLGVAVLILFCMVLLQVHSARWVCLALLFYVSTYAAGEIKDDPTLAYLQIPFPLSIIRNYAREFTILLTACLLIPLLRSSTGWRRHFVSAGLIFYFILQLWMCIRLYAGGDSAPRSLLSLLSYGLIFATLAIGVGRSLQSIDDAYALIASFAFAGFLFAISNAYHAILNPVASYTGRFFGITTNPQYVGESCALFLIPTIFLTHSPRIRYFWKPFLWTSAALLIIFLIWSGSRTGVLMAAGGLLTLYRHRIDRIIVTAVFVGIAFFFALPFFPDAMGSLAHILSTENSRADAWQALLDTYRQNPTFGAQYGGTGYGESYYLATLAYYGNIGFVPAILVMIAYVLGVAQIFRKKSAFGPDAALVDFLAAGMIMIVAISVFESGLLGVWNTAELFLIVQFAFLAFLRDRLAQTSDEAAADPSLEFSPDPLAL